LLFLIRVISVNSRDRRSPRMTRITKAKSQKPRAKSSSNAWPHSRAENLRLEIS